MDADPVSAARLSELAIALHDLSWWVQRVGPAQVGLAPLSATELAVLRAIVDRPDRSVSEVAASLAMQSSNVSAAVRGLVDHGLIEKEPNSHDRRMCFLHPTAQARADRDAVEEAIASTVISALGAVPAERVATLLDALPAVRELTVLLTSPGVTAAPATTGATR